MIVAAAVIAPNVSQKCCSASSLQPQSGPPSCCLPLPASSGTHAAPATLYLTCIDSLFRSPTQNSPLYLSTFGGEDDSARLSTMVHCSLDAVEEKGGCLRRRTAEAGRSNACSMQSGEAAVMPCVQHA